ncbi:hypothetical protein OUZ56_009677 [Daphnia magna]|uniref:Uncharacterized protein n=1 Tax=Daphnia magna TaxID=35525 RepID=A0ABR0AGU1_9CRUS|nr:hypothetical protein OUZ56_009677 [Daphnia magna]
MYSTVYDRLEGEWDFTEPQFIKPFYHLLRQIPTLLTPPISTLTSTQYRSTFRAPCIRMYDYRSKSKTIYLHYHHKKMISESESDKSFEEERAVARRKLDEALIEKKKQFQNLRNIKGRTVKRRDTDQQQRLTAFKESYKGKKEVPQRNKPWSVLEWQNHWNSLDQRQQDNLDRKKSHCHIICVSKRRWN